MEIITETGHVHYLLFKSYLNTIAIRPGGTLQSGDFLMNYELYWISGSPYSWRVMLAMAIKGLDYRSHRLDPEKGEHKTKEYLAINPRGKVPALTDGDTVIYESMAIIAYLEAKHPEPALFGATPGESGHIWQCILNVENYIQGPHASVTIPIFFGGIEEKKEDVIASAKIYHAELANLNETLSGSDYLAGDRISAADVAYYPLLKMLQRAVNREDAKPLNLGFDDFEGLYPELVQWAGRMESLPGYDKTYPPHWR